MDVEGLMEIQRGILPFETSRRVSEYVDGCTRPALITMHTGRVCGNILSI